MYNALLKRDGRVNNKKFYEEVILPEIPSYDMSSWYKFLKRFKTEIGIVPITPAAPVVQGEAGKELAATLLTNHEATQRAIQAALNISADALQQILENPELLPVDKRAELFVKIMKAQDSRVKAIGGIRADNREQERFDRMMNNAAFQ